jgi:flagellar motility protein MotE (MotC chaperone)
MSAMPRLLPVIAVAVGGVLALKALSGVQALPQMLSPAQASAAEAPRAAPAKAKPKPPAAAPGPAAPPKVCAPGAADLAREAGLSPGELEVLQNLGTRRGQLDQRERDLDTKIQLLGAAEMKLDAKLKALNALKAEVQGLLGQGDQRTQAEVDRLVQVYTKMNPRAAGPVMAALDDKVRVPIAAALKPQVLADILKNMSPDQAKTLTEALAHRFAPQQAALQAASAKMKPGTPIDPLAQTPETDAVAANDAAAKPQAAPKPKPRRVAHARPRPVHKPAAVAAKADAKSAASPASAQASVTKPPAKAPAISADASKTATSTGAAKPAASPSGAAPAKAG